MQVLLSPPFSLLILGYLKFPPKVHVLLCFEMPLCTYEPANNFSDLRFRDRTFAIYISRLRFYISATAIYISHNRDLYITFAIYISDCIPKNIPREFGLSLIILIQFSPSASSPQGLS